MNFNYSGRLGNIRNYKVEPDQTILNRFKDLWSDWDIDAYLPDDTMAWCEKALQETGYKVPVDHTLLAADGKAVHTLAYIDLRAELTVHIRGGNEAGLGLLRKPAHSYDWKPEPLQVAVGLKEAAEADSDDEGVQFANEGRDSRMQKGDDDIPGSSSEESDDSDSDKESDRRGYLSDGHASDVESDSEDDLGRNIRRGFCRMRAAIRRRRWFR